MQQSELVYASGRKGVQAIDPRTGHVVWSRRLGGWFGGYITMCLHDEMLLVAHKDTLYAFRAESGDLLWESKVLTEPHKPTMLLSGKAGSDQSSHAMMAQQQAQQAAMAAAAASSAAAAAAASS